MNRKKRRGRIWIPGLLLIALLVQSCSSPAMLGQRTTPAPKTPTPPGTATPPSGFTPPAQATNTPGGPLTLRVWVPPQFDPTQDTSGTRLLRERLSEFTKQRPRVQLEVRVKALQGPGGLLDALTTSKAAAPQAAPDLIALPRELLETAALKGLLTPFTPSSYADVAKDWYTYARDLAHLQDSVYGLPFAGDALALVYRPASWPESPETWEDTLQVPNSLLFNAADPQALLTLSHYQAIGGQVRDEQGKPTINSLILTEVLTYYRQAAQASITPLDIAQVQSDDQAWTMFRDAGTPGVITWTSRFLGDAYQAPLNERSLAALPTRDGKPYSLATGWVWSLSSPDAERQLVAVELARFLTDPNFLAAWTESAGYLPPYTGALAAWKREEIHPVLDHIARSAQILPSGDILAALSGPLRQATMATLTGQTDPVVAAQQAAAGLTAP